MAKCAVDGCDRTSRARGWCQKHYLNWYRTGDTNGLTRHAECIIEGCDKVPASTRKGICELHRARIKKYGDPHKIGRRRDVVAYHSAHQRLSVDRGPARSHLCVDCGDRADHWSYDYSDPNPRFSRQGAPYSLDQDRYQPRCASCHLVFDRGYERRRA